MTLRQAIESGTRAVRKPFWNPTAKLELPPLLAKGHGPWCKLHDCGAVQEILFLEAEDHQDDWLAVA